MSGGGRLDLLIAVLPDPAEDAGAAPLDVGKLAARCGASVIEQLNAALLAKAAAAKAVTV